MLLLQRLTSEYIDSEDRLRLSAETDAGDTLILWITQRLLTRLLPHLLKWLHPDTAAVAANPNPDERTADILQGFAQQAAQARQQPEAPVQSQGSADAWLVHEVDIKHAEQELVLVFKSASKQEAALPLNAQQLRQWLGIVYKLWVLAEWPTPEALWPQWLTEAVSSNTPPIEGNAVH